VPDEFPIDSGGLAGCLFIALPSPFQKLLNLSRFAADRK